MDRPGSPLQTPKASEKSFGAFSGHLPDELWQLCFNGLTDAQLKGARLTCRQWRRCIDDPGWRNQRLEHQYVRPALVQIEHQIVHDGRAGPWPSNGPGVIERLHNRRDAMRDLAEQCRKLLATYTKMEAQSAWTRIETLGSWTRWLPCEDKIPHVIVFLFTLDLALSAAPGLMVVACAYLLWVCWHMVGVIFEELSESNQKQLQKDWDAPSNQLLREGLAPRVLNFGAIIENLGIALQNWDPVPR